LQQSVEGKSSALKVACTKKNETTDKLIWRCVKRDDAVKCTAILQTSKNMDNPDMKKPHNH
jgi:predicted RNA-binding protein with PIN domain